MKNCDILFLSGNAVMAEYQYSLTNFNSEANSKNLCAVSKKGDRPWSRLMLIKSGTAKFEGKGFTPFYAGKGSLLYYPTDCEFSVSWENSEKHSGEKILSKIMAFKLFDRNGRELLFSDTPTVLKSDCAEAENEIFDKGIAAYSGASVTSKLICTSLLFELFAVLLSPSSGHECDRFGVQSALKYVNNNFKSEITLEKLLAVSHTSESTLRRGFIAEVGLSPVRYINKVRMNKAYELLTGTEMSVGSIATEVGIPDISYFSKIFKLFYGISPSQVRSKSV